jgi:hypothetical protein
MRKLENNNNCPDNIISEDGYMTILRDSALSYHKLLWLMISTGLRSGELQSLKNPEEPETEDI